MPELPEVETVRRLLQARLIGRTIHNSVIDRPEILRGKAWEECGPRLPGCLIESVTRRGKYLLLNLTIPASEEAPATSDVSDSQRWTLAVHLKMRGSLRVERTGSDPGPYLCARLELENGQSLRFYDMWRWGEWWLLPTNDVMDTIPALLAMGPEPFDPSFSSESLHQALRKRKMAIKPLLLGQKVMAGLGNIYCDEALHQARLHPSRPAHGLDAEETRRLYGAIRDVLGTAIAQGGAYAERQAQTEQNIETLDDVYTPRIYNRPGHPCPDCKTALIKISFHGRGTTFCPLCQSVAETPDTI